MGYLFDINEWVYYSAILLCAVLGIIIYALQDRYSIAAIGPSSDSSQKRARVIKIFTFIMLGYIVFWAAIRNGIVDTREYIMSYEMLDPNSKFIDIFSKTDGSYDNNAPLFKIYQLILKKLGFNWHWYLGSVAVFSGLCIYYGISKYSDDVVLSCFIFIADLEFYWLFNGIRQFIVVAMFFAAFRLMAEKKLLKFLIFVFVMYFIHTSAIILIPIYFIANMKNWSVGIFACIFTTMVIVLLFPNQVNNWIDKAFGDYGYLDAVSAINDDGANILRVAVALVPSVLSFIYRKEIQSYNNPYVNIMVNLSLITTGLYAVANVSSGIFVGRLPIYTETFNILLLPFIIHQVVPKKAKSIIYISCILGYFLYFHLQARNGGLYYTTDLIDGMDLGGFTLEGSI